MKIPNIDANVVSGFGDEWSRFDQSRLNAGEHARLFDEYFDIFPWDELPPDAIGFDLGCGSGRWAKLVAPRVGTLHLIDPSDAIEIARRNLTAHENCEFHRAGVDDIPIPDDSADFGYSLGVLHHVPDTAMGLSNCVSKLKTGSPFLLYLYYRFDNRPRWFRVIWQISDTFRRLISRMPYSPRYWVSQLIAGLIYWPLAMVSRFLDSIGIPVGNLPLSQYRNKSFYTMRTDALDRFGTRLEQRFTRDEIYAMMVSAGLERIEFSSTVFWVAVGYKK